VRTDLPSGTVTFLFTDVEGSTRLLHEFGADAYAEALADHRRAIREACVANGGVEVDTQGDAFFFAFPTAPGAVLAASAMTEALAAGPIRVRAGLHTGTPLLSEEGYIGDDVHRAARIAAAGHGGQVLVSTTTAGLVDLELTELGEHRFKDLAAPERVYQLGDGSFPALKSLYRTNLPVPATTFLGREQELAEIAELLQDGARLLTLTGPGGTGKTRLAIQAAAEAAESFPDGLWWVPLAPLRDANLLVSSVAQSLGVEEQPGRELARSVAEQLAGKQTLLVLDNAEHLMPKVASKIAELRDVPRHEPRAVAAPGRARVLGAVARRGRRGRALPDACAGAAIGCRKVGCRGGALLAAGQPSPGARAGRRTDRRLLARAARRAPVATARPPEGRARR
jgi:class 3 adenylate cyclase